MTVKLTINEDWLRYWSGAYEAPGQYPNQFGCLTSNRVVRLEWPQIFSLTLVQVMAPRVLRTKPLTHPTLTFWQPNVSWRSQVSISKDGFEMPSLRCLVFRCGDNELIGVPLTLSQNWLRQWPGSQMTSSQYFNQCWARYQTSYWVTGLQWPGSQMTSSQYFN